MKTSTTLKIITTSFVFVFATMSFSGNASAERHLQRVNGKEVVVHTNPIPVILHRMVPPQLGRHVTQKEVSKGTTPHPQLTTSIRKRSS